MEYHPRTPPDLPADAGGALKSALELRLRQREEGGPVPWRRAPEFRVAGEVGTGSETFAVIKFECLDDPGRTSTLTAGPSESARSGR